MRIGLLLFDLYIGGISSYVRTLASELERKGHEVHIITTARKNVIGEERSIIHRSNFLAWHQHTPLNFLSMLSLRGILKDVSVSEKLDIVNSLSGFTWLSLVPYFNYLETGVPYCHTVFYKVNKSNIPLKLLSEVGISSLKRSKKVICISKNIQKNLNLRNSTVIYPSVNTREFLPGKTKTNTVQFIGSLAPWRGARILAEAMPEVIREIPDAKFEFYSNFDVYGNFEVEYNRILKIIRENKLDENFKLLGPQKEISKMMMQSEIFVLPITRESETADVPISILEAMACGKTVVTTRTGGISEIIENGKNGIMVRNNTPQEFAEIIVSLLSNRRKTREIGSNARKTAELKFNSKKMVDDVESVYSDILKLS